MKPRCFSFPSIVLIPPYLGSNTSILCNFGESLTADAAAKKLGKKKQIFLMQMPTLHGLVKKRAVVHEKAKLFKDTSACIRNEHSPSSNQMAGAS